jgi:ankyrin repeat protein
MYTRSTMVFLAEALREGSVAGLFMTIDDVFKMRKIFKTGLSQQAIDYFIFQVNSIDMLKLFIQYRGDIHKLGPPGLSKPIFPAHVSFGKGYRCVKFLKMIRFIINERVDLNVVDKEGNTAFSLCARNGEERLCDYLVEGGAIPPC